MQGTPEGGLAQGTLRAPCPKCGSGPRVPSGRVVGYPRERSGPGYPKTAFDPNAGWVPGYLRGVFVAKKLGGAPNARTGPCRTRLFSCLLSLVQEKGGSRLPGRTYLFDFSRSWQKVVRSRMSVCCLSFRIFFRAATSSASSRFLSARGAA